MMQFLCPRCGKLFMGVDRAGEVDCPRCKFVFIPDTLDDTIDLPAAHGPKQEFAPGAEGTSEKEVETKAHFEMVMEPEGREVPDHPPAVDDTQHLRYSSVPAEDADEAFPSEDAEAWSDADPDREPETGTFGAAGPDDVSTTTETAVARRSGSRRDLTPFHWVVIVVLAAGLAAYGVVHLSLPDDTGRKERLQELVERARDALEENRLEEGLSLLTEASGLSKTELVRSLLTDARLRLCEKELDRGDADAAESWLHMARWDASGEHVSRLKSCKKRLAQLRSPPVRDPAK